MKRPTPEYLKETENMMKAKYNYQWGFNNEFQTEARPGALPIGQNNPQQCPLGLYCEQISGTSFTVPRGFNKRTWVYRELPSVTHSHFKPFKSEGLLPSLNHCEPNPNQCRWLPPEIPKEPTDFVQGLRSWCGAGSPDMKNGLQILYYVANTDMKDRAFFNSDGEFLIVPQLGTLDIITEMGWLEVAPNEIIVIPRGIVFSVKISGEDKQARGYICEIFESSFTLPNLGPIGSNGLANPRDFRYPVAAYEDREVPYEVVCKFQGKLFSCSKTHSPFNVVAWHGNYAPYAYALSNFCCINSVTFDHPDPSIYCVLTAPSMTPGVAIADFVIFPPRWEAKDHTFRPPWYHRNTMSEFMGLIFGQYEAKKEGFIPGGASLHSCFIPHGPDVTTFETASKADISQPKRIENTMAFMFETTFLLRLSPLAQEKLDQNYINCWSGLKNYHREQQQQQQHIKNSK
jgi:homogentisate 1,2-dioxygenase